MIRNPRRLPHAAGLLAVSLAVAVSAASAVAGPSSEAAHGRGHDDDRGHDGRGHGHWRTAFAPIASFDVMAGNGSAVAEIVDVSENGRTLVYTDAGNGEVGLVDIGDPGQPAGLGTIDVGGSPTSVAVRGRHALVAVDTTTDLDTPTGKLVVIDLHTRAIVAEHDLGGQPDSIALAPNGLRAAIVIENQRDEDENDGLLPQAPSGGLVIARLVGLPPNWTFSAADLSPVAAAAADGSDLEPEFVDINRRDEAVVSFQENNHLAIVNLRTGKTIANFPAGEAELRNVDTAEEDLITLDTTITRRREPDAVAWISDDAFATANEGDYEDANGEAGGSRGFTVFRRDGTVLFESHESFEHALVRIGHYNEGRSENKGVEPEAIEYGRFGGRSLLFVGSERSNAVGVYDVHDGEPELLQLLPTGISPEGLKAIPARGLFVASTETDEAGAGIPTMINIYRERRGPAPYPMLASADDTSGLPIPWVALSGLAGDRHDAGILYAVSDAFLARGFVYTLDVTQRPARIVERLEVTGIADGVLDLEGIAVGPDGAFWLGSEGNASSKPNLVLKVDATSGAILQSIELPPGLVDRRRSNGIEGIAVTGAAGAEVVYVAIQRAWPNEGDTDGVNTKIGRYDVATGTWGFVHYPLQPVGQGDWIGLSELTALPDGTFAVIERDKGWGPSTGFNAELKALFRVDLAGAEFRAFDDASGLVTIGKSLVANLLPQIAARSIWTAEKLEGFAVAADGRTYAVTDNDGVDDATGETVFLRLGHIERLLDLEVEADDAE
jgi:hypothetical protein